MGYKKLKNVNYKRKYAKNSLEENAIKFIRESCEGLRFSDDNETKEEQCGGMLFLGTSLEKGQIPYNMEKDIDRLCLENAVARFLESGRKEDAFDVYFCYLEMFVGEDYEKTRRMIELLSEFEANGSGLLMKHRDHYSHSVYVFVLGLAIYESNEIYREKYAEYYGIEKDSHAAAHHFIEYWGMTALFHDIGYPFELPFEQVCSYFEVERDGTKRKEHPYLAYQNMKKFVCIDGTLKEALSKLYADERFASTDELFAYELYKKLGKEYPLVKEDRIVVPSNKPGEPDEEKKLSDKPGKPEGFGYFMDHAYFSATILLQKLFGEIGCELRAEHMDALTAILMHNSLFKFCITDYKKTPNQMKVEYHPLAYMLMLCDELQCWDRTAYGRDSRKELHPMGCMFDFSENAIKASYLFDKGEIAKIEQFKDDYTKWIEGGKQGDAPKLKAYSGMYLRNEKSISDFQDDIEHIVDLSEIKLKVETGIGACVRAKNASYLSDSNYINLYRFAMILNGRWSSAEWKSAKAAGREEQFLSDEKNKNKNKFAEDFKKLSLEYKLSNLNQAKAFAGYLNEINAFYTDKSVDFDMLESFSQEELLKIGPLEHKRWLQEHYDMGWTYDTPAKKEREFKRQHKDMIPGLEQGGERIVVSDEQAQKNYDRLDQAEQDKDTEPMECMLAMLRMFDGLRIYRLR